MAKFKRKDIVSIYNIKPATLRQHFKRMRVFEDENGDIDTEDPRNRLYFEDIKINLSAPVSAPVVSSEPVKEVVNTPVKEPVKKQKTTRKTKQVDASVVVSNGDARYNLDIEMKKSSLILKKKEIELKDIEIKKKAGELLPFELIKQVIIRNNATVFTHLNQEIRNQAGNMTNDREELAHLEGVMQKSLQRSIDKAGEELQAELTNIVKEYSESRTKGQNK